jgi:Kdo2-lipid IVA lauroyltransferase/acyltransferase
MKASEAIQFKSSFLHPKYWGIWFGVGLLKIVHNLPYSIQFKLGKLLGIVMFFIARKRRKIAHANIKRAFPAMDYSDRKNIVKANFESMGVAFIEMAFTWWGNHRKNFNHARERQLIKYVGEENLRMAESKGKGVLVLTPHFTHLEMTGLINAFITDLYSVYKPNKNPLLDYLIIKGRTLGPNQCLPIDYKNTRRIIKTLREGKNIGYLPDQRYRGKGHLNVPFFGHDAKSHSATSKLAKLTDCAIVPCFTRRIGQHYETHFLPPLENFPSGDDYADTLRLHQLYEHEINQNPTQYLWVHNRWDLTNQQINQLNQED